MEVKKISIGCDHAGFPHKDAIKDLLSSLNIEITDYGTHSLDSVDYPDFIHPVAEDVEGKKADFGIILCGSGNGAAMTANKHQGIRAALCWQNDLASLARQHNDANVLAIPVRFVSEDTALQMVKIFISTEFEGGRHERRVNKISCD
ncbi:MAG: ribose 5-phosphate isomerase B [Bacteroidetes bacterium]|nr:MAG: ribose 5-phosphate isomerase B [Bacteroidota bacterium]